MDTRDRGMDGESEVATAYGWSWLRGLALAARIGVHPHEQGRTQPVHVDVGMWLDFAAAVASDAVAATADWDAVVAVVSGTVGARHYGLVETLCEALAAAVLRTQPRVLRVRICVRKPESVRHGMASVAITRRRATASAPADYSGSLASAAAAPPSPSPGSTHS